MKLGLSILMAALCLLRIYTLIGEIGLFALFNVLYAVVWLVSAVMLRFEFRRYLRQEWLTFKGYWLLSFLSSAYVFYYEFTHFKDALGAVSYITMILLVLTSFLLTTLSCIFPKDFLSSHNEMMHRLLSSNSRDQVITRKRKQLTSDLQRGSKISANVTGYNIKDGRLFFILISYVDGIAKNKLKKTFNDFRDLDLKLITKYKYQVEANILRKLDLPKVDADAFRKLDNIEQIRKRLNSYLEMFFGEENVLTREVLQFLEFEKSEINMLMQMHRVNSRDFFILDDYFGMHRMAGAPNPRDFLLSVWTKEEHFKLQVDRKFDEETDEVWYTIVLNQTFHFEKRMDDIWDLRRELVRSRRVRDYPDLPPRERVSLISEGDVDRYVVMIHEFFSRLLNDPEYYCFELYEFFDKCELLEVMIEINNLLVKFYLEDESEMLQFQEFLNFAFQVQIISHQIRLNEEKQPKIFF